MLIRLKIAARQRPPAAGLAALLVIGSGLAVLAIGCAASPAPIDADPASGFAIYRSGLLSAGELAQLCRAGVEEMVVMDGAATDRECRLREKVCPQLRVRYNFRQDARVPVSKDFLRAFDGWVDESRVQGRRVAFRCRHGWHRAGRLAAYYRMRFQSWTVEQATREMLQRGQMMSSFPELPPQLEALKEIIDGQVCSRGPLFCPHTPAVDAGALRLAAESVGFLRDACDPGGRGEVDES